MELVLLALLPFVLAIIFLTSLATTALVTWAYTRTCFDGTERSGKRYWRAFRKACCCIPCLRSCYGWRVEGDRPMDAGLYAVHPHGMLAIGVAMNLLGPDTEVRMAVHSWIFTIPIIRDLMLWIGCIDVTPETIGVALARGWRVGLVPGGVRELNNDKQKPAGFLQWSYYCWKAPVIPVWLPDEMAICHVWTPSRLAWLREVGMKWLRYPMGTFFWPRFGLPQSRARYGHAVMPTDYEEYPGFEAAYWAELERLKSL